MCTTGCWGLTCTTDISLLACLPARKGTPRSPAALPSATAAYLPPSAAAALLLQLRLLPQPHHCPCYCCIRPTSCYCRLPLLRPPTCYVQTNPEKRLGSGPGGADDIKKHRWFSRLDWKALEAKKLPAPIRPRCGCGCVCGGGGEGRSGSMWWARRGPPTLCIKCVLQVSFLPQPATQRNSARSTPSASSSSSTLDHPPGPSPLAPWIHDPYPYRTRTPLDTYTQITHKLHPLPPLANLTPLQDPQPPGHIQL